MTGHLNPSVVGSIAAALASVAAPAGAEAPQAGLQGSFPIVELRQYTLHDGQRDTLIDLFEREFIESQEALGMRVIGTFRDLDRPNRFVWLRGFRDMDSRLAGLTAFYGGPVWKAHRETANATMIDSDNVLLLHAPVEAAEFEAGGSHPAFGEAVPAGLVVATVYYLKVPAADALPIFESQVQPRLEQAGATPIAWFVPATEANNFPRLPVRENESVLVWFTRLSGAADHAARAKAIDAAAAPLAPLLAKAPEVLRLEPTSRSQLR